ncbi:MAG TPA: divergent polysaccharide deacetylase family protein [Thermoanaerobaculia bacterium]|nr:divergent polysaccharide deacetylase family protein [Thermoanaerobaculia bacterium]
MARRRSRSARRSGFSGLWLFLLGLLAGAAGLYMACGDTSLSSRSEEPAAASAQGGAAAAAVPAPASHTGGSAAKPVPDEPAPDEPAPSGDELAAAEPGGRIALVIDDLGRSVEDLDTLARLGVPVSYAVLPFEEQTPAVVTELRRRGAEILCHLPMEPKNGEDPGPGALRLGMGRDELREKTLAALGAVPGAAGVNNHMGSGLSADEGSMEAILQVLSGRGLFFLDSRTSAESVGYRVARELGIPAAERQVFLDADQTPEAIQAQFQRLLGLARTRGAAIAIGHPHPATLATLAAEVPKAKAQGYEFVPVSYLLDRPDQDAE